jgi:hypothetical protein
MRFRHIGDRKTALPDWLATFMALEFEIEVRERICGLDHGDNVAITGKHMNMAVEAGIDNKIAGSRFFVENERMHPAK